mgnify:CR=1 FL=1
MPFDVAQPRAVLPELPGVPVGTAQRQTAHDGAATDAARAAVEVDELIDPAAGAEQPLGMCPHRRVVVREGRQSDGVLHDARERNLAPTEVGSPAHQAVRGTHESGDGQADHIQSHVGTSAAPELPDEIDDDRRGLLGARGRGHLAAHALHHASAQPDDPGGDGVDLGVDRYDTDPGGGFHAGRGPSDAIAGGWLGLDDQTERGELGDERADRRTIATGERGHVGAGGGVATVHQLEHGREIALSHAVDPVERAGHSPTLARGQTTP